MIAIKVTKSSSFLWQSVLEAIGVPYAAPQVNNREDDVINESIDNSFTSNEFFWKDCRRGISLINSRECNEIVRQFMEIEFDNRMILSEMSNQI